MASVAVLSLGLGWSEGGWMLLAGFAAGGAFTACCFFACFHLPLARAARACRSISSGDLGQTVPVAGTSQLREVTATINAMAADFQEILLMFAHLARSAMQSATLLQAQLDRGRGDASHRERASEVIEDIYEMQEMVQSFKYFRVRFENGRTIDTGITPTETLAELKAADRLETRAVSPLEGENDE